MHCVKSLHDRIRRTVIDHFDDGVEAGLTMTVENDSKLSNFLILGV